MASGTMQVLVKLRLEAYLQREVTDFKYVGDYSKRSFKKIDLFRHFKPTFHNIVMPLLIHKMIVIPS